MRQLHTQSPLYLRQLCGTERRFEPQSGIQGVAESYQPGDVLRARVVGVTLAEGQSFQWSIRPIGATSSGYLFTGTGDQAPQGTVEQLLDASHDGYELRVRLRTGTTVVSTSDWVPIRAEDAAVPPLAGLTPHSRSSFRSPLSTTTIS